jgi:hypothetical protein
MKKRFGEFGIKHELSKRWTLWDWYKSRDVSKRITPEIADQVISDLILLGKPALVGRLGGTEARFLGEYFKITRFNRFSKILFRLKPNWHKRSREINSNAGFYFENLFQISAFYDLYDSALLDTDVLGTWGTAFAWFETRYIKDIKSLVPVPMTAPWVEPYLPSSSSVAWSASLHDKKVLIVSPFVESIINQHKRINKVFPDNTYPAFQLTTIKAPQTVGFDSASKPDWFENLDYMKKLMSSADFDVALIAAGAYSYPLAHHAKSLGKIGIHAGGGLQLFFGIIGKRWEVDWGENNYVKKYFNSFWVRPTRNETPYNAHQVEDGCYW